MSKAELDYDKLGRQIADAVRGSVGITLETRSTGVSVERSSSGAIVGFSDTGEREITLKFRKPVDGADAT